MEHLHIFVNRRKFDETNGVKPEMTGAEIAALVNVPADNAIVRGPRGEEIGIKETVRIKDGEQFIVTRHVVEGGHVSGTH